MNKVKSLLTAILGTAALFSAASVSAQEQLLASWDFEELTTSDVESPNFNISGSSSFVSNSTFSSSLGLEIESTDGINGNYIRFSHGRTELSPTFTFTFTAGESDLRDLRFSYDAHRSVNGQNSSYATHTWTYFLDGEPINNEFSMTSEGWQKNELKLENVILLAGETLTIYANLTAIGGNGNPVRYTNFDNFQLHAAATAAIPEPSTYAAIFGGLALLGVIVRRRFVKK